MSILTPVCSIILLIVFPPEPITSFILSTGICSDTILGAYFDNSFLGSGIVGINNGQLRKDTGAIYDLSGRKIANSQRPTAKGLYIMNGKKVAIP